MNDPIGDFLDFLFIRVSPWVATFCAGMAFYWLLLHLWWVS